MKSVLKIKIRALDYYNMKRISFVKKVTVKDVNFVDKVRPALFINGGVYQLPASVNTAKSQADEWFSEQSQMHDEIIHNPHRELNCILDWEIVSIQNFGQVEPHTEKQSSEMVLSIPKKPTEAEKIRAILVEVDKVNPLSQSFKDNFQAVYNEMSESLKGLPIEKKVLIVFKSMGVGFKASAEAYRHITEYMRTPIEEIKQLNK